MFLIILLLSIIDRAGAKLSVHFLSSCRHFAPLLCSSHFKITNDLSLCDSPDRCEADVNPRQIKSYCGGWVCALKMASIKAEKEACHAIPHVGASAAGCELCPPAGVWCGRQLTTERPVSVGGDPVLHLTHIACWQRNSVAFTPAVYHTVEFLNYTFFILTRRIHRSLESRVLSGVST